MGYTKTGNIILKNVPGGTWAEVKEKLKAAVEAKKQSKGLSAKTVRNIHQVISPAMDFAKDQKLIAGNPTDGCVLPKLEHREMKTLPAEQLTSFLREAKETGVFEMYYIGLATGLRRGELLGLKWEDIDLERGSLRVQRQVCRIDGEIVEASLKTKGACRVLPLSADAVEVLREQRGKSRRQPICIPVSCGRTHFAGQRTPSQSGSALGSGR